MTAETSAKVEQSGDYVRYPCRFIASTDRWHFHFPNYWGYEGMNEKRCVVIA
jgi:hypothetical protein